MPARRHPGYAKNVRAEKRDRRTTDRSPLSAVHAILCRLPACVQFKTVVPGVTNVFITPRKLLISFGFATRGGFPGAIVKSFFRGV